MPSNRDIMELKQHHHPKLIELLLKMNSDIHAVRQAVGNLATMMNQLADLLGQQQVVMGTMKGYVERLKAMGMEVGSDPSITGEVDGDKG